MGGGEIPSIGKNKKYKPLTILSYISNNSDFLVKYVSHVLLTRFCFLVLYAVMQTRNLCMVLVSES